MPVGEPGRAVEKPGALRDFFSRLVGHRFKGQAVDSIRRTEIERLVLEAISAEIGEDKEQNLTRNLIAQLVKEPADDKVVLETLRRIIKKARANGLKSVAERAERAYRDLVDF